MFPPFLSNLRFLKKAFIETPMAYPSRCGAKSRIKETGAWSNQECWQKNNRFKIGNCAAGKKGKCAFSGVRYPS